MIILCHGVKSFSSHGVSGLRVSKQPMVLFVRECMVLSHEMMVFLRLMIFVHDIPSSTHSICKWFLWREWYERVLDIYKLDDPLVVIVFGS